MDIWTTAMAFEKEGEEFYWELAEKTENRGIKNICLMLARDEAEHIKVLEKLSRGQIPEKPDSGIFEEAKTVFRRFIDDIFDTGEPLAPEEFYSRAMRLEKKTIEYYEQQADAAQNPEDKTLFEQLAAEEVKHFIILRSILDYRQNAAQWINSRKFDDLGK